MTKKIDKKVRTTGSIRTIGTRGKIDVSALLQEGVVTLLECGRCRLEERLTLKDLCMDGIESDLLSEYVTLGRKSLISPVIQRELNSIESAARYAVKRFSLVTPFGLFVPAAAYPALEKEMNKFEQRWYEGRDKLVAHIKNHEADITKTYKELALSIFKLMKASNVSSKSKASFASQYAKRILKAVPTAHEVYNSFHFSFQTFQVPMPAILNAKVRAEILQEHKMAQKLITIDKKEANVRTMNALIALRYQKNKEETIDRFLDTVNKQVRGKVYDAVKAALYTINKHKSTKAGLQGRTVAQIKNMIDSFKMLNILNDTEMEKALDHLEAELNFTGKDRKIGDITERLIELKDIAEDQFLDMGYVGRTPRGEIIPDHDMPTEGMDLPTGRRLATIEVADEVEAV